MGLFDVVKGHINAFLTGANNKINQSTMEGIMASLALITMGDGKVSDAEIQQVLTQIAAHPILSKYPATETNKVFEGFLNQLKASPTMGKIQVSNAIKKLATQPAEATLTVAMCCDVGAADGNFDDDEKKIVRDICSWVGVPASDFHL